MTLKEKLHPRNFSDISPMMSAIVGCILGEKYTDPQITHLYATSDGFVLAQHSNDIGANDFIGTHSDLKRNWETLLDAARLSANERRQAGNLYQLAIMLH